MNPRILTSLTRLSKETCVFYTTLLFCLALLLINPSNKIVAASFFALFTALFFIIRNLSWSLLFTFVASLIVTTGKSYPIQLLPPGVLPEEIFPQGYFVHLVVAPSHIISFLMMLYLIRQVLVGNVSLTSKSFRVSDVFLLVFFLLRLISALIGSKNPQFSLASEVLSLPGLVLYFYVRLLIKADARYWKLLAYILCGLVAFESILGFSQLLAKSPLYKNIEFQVNIEYFGKAIDEPSFAFRPVGTFDHANTFGIWLASLLTFLFVFLSQRASNIVWTVFVVGSFMLIATLSRSAWLGFSVAMVFSVFFLQKSGYFVLKRFLQKAWRWRVILVPVCIVFVFLFIVPRAELSFYSFGRDAGALFYRRTQIQDAMEIIKLRPIFGIGSLMSVYEGISLDLYTVASSIPLAVHNWYLSVALENGPPALLAFVFFVLLSIKRILYGQPKKTSTSLGIAASVLCLSIAALFQPYIHTDFIYLLLASVI